MTVPTTQVIIVSPSALHRAAWQALLGQQPGLVVTGTAADMSKIELFVHPNHLHAVLLDHPVPQPLLVQQGDPARAPGILVLVPSYELAAILALLQVGATGCLSHDASVGDLARALIAVGRGELVLPPAIAARALTALARGEALHAPLEPLSEREVDVVRLLASGLTNKDIAQTLILSVRTVEAHLRSIFVKIDVRSRTEAALWAVRHGYGTDH